jgi:predicted Zn-ribbon and HTH transcriptional regulator
MALAKRFVCTVCAHTIDAWDDGNPYYFDQHGTKQYAYHPQTERALCVGNDSPHLCLDCGTDFLVDSRAPATACPQCASIAIAATFTLEGRRCPSCKAGVFTVDPNFVIIS